MARRCSSSNARSATPPTCTDPVRQGPPLFKIVGRPAGTLDGFHYSPGFARAEFVWDDAHLDAWLTNPQKLIPGRGDAVPPGRSEDPRHHHRMAEGAALMAKPIHSMIRVLDEARSVDFYRRAFGMRGGRPLDFDGFTLVYLRGEGNGFELELTINHGRTEPYALGDGYGHIAFVVDDLAAEHARFASDGAGARTRSANSIATAR